MSNRTDPNHVIIVNAFLLLENDIQIKLLKEREIKVLKMRYKEKYTYRKTGNFIENLHSKEKKTITGSRVMQIEFKAIKKLMRLSRIVETEIIWKINENNM